ncbi:hypothetical protein F4824DRAFT_458846 [Ustulina deusta]|nr:hypothetical protein F4824DRAFT_458846 [Ustulina deusta]
MKPHSRPWQQVSASIAQTNDPRLFLLVVVFPFFLCFALWEAISRYLRQRRPISTRETRKRRVRRSRINRIRTEFHRRLRCKPVERVQVRATELHIPSKAAASGESQELDHGGYAPTRLPEWLEEMLKKESRLDVTIQQSSSTPQTEVSTADDDESSALCRRADEEWRQGQLFKAIDTYVHVIRIQLKSHQLRKSSPSRQALSRICQILIQVFPEIYPPLFGVREWWFSNALEIEFTLANFVSKIPQSPLSSVTVDALQTLAEYIVKWYAPEALSCAALLYERILSQLDGEFSFSRNKRRSHCVKELAKIYVELSTRGESAEPISSAKHAIIREGRREIEKCSISERMQFYQHLGALYVQNAGKDPQCSGREGEEILRRIHEVQKQLFGRADYRSVKTVDILSRYYVEQGGRDIEAAQLIEDALKATDRPTPRYGDSEDEAGEENKNRGYWSDEDSVVGLDVGVEGAGDERKRRAIREWERSIVRKDTWVTSHDFVFQRILWHGTLQARLMTLLAPPNCVWQDSRLYLSDIAKIQFRRVAITDTLENYPIRVTRLKNGEVDVQAPIIAHPLSTNDKDMSMRVSEMINSVRESNFYELLRSGAGLDHFAVQRPETTLECQVDHNLNVIPNSGVRDKTSDLQPNLATSDIDHVFWVFSRGLNAATTQEQVYGGDKGIPAKYVKKWSSYQFLKLPDRLEWMVVVTESTKIGLSYRVRDLFGDLRPAVKYRHHVKNYSWDWVLSDNLVGSTNEADGSGISIVCPYVTYEELSRVKGFGWGFTYADFVQQLRSSRGVEDTHRILEIKKAMCKEWSAEAKKELPTIVFDEARETPQSGTSQENDGGFHQRGRIGDYETEGFFNNIPGSGAWVHHENLTPGFNLVSSHWVDWKAFVVNDSSLTTAYPKLRSANGDPIKCRGYISGNWILGNLEGRYVMEKVFVIDAVFAISSEPRVRRDFVFCQDTFTENSRAEMTSTEKRCLISNLNPLVFRHVEPGEPMVGASWINKRKRKLAYYDGIEKAGGADLRLRAEEREVPR